MGSFHGAYPPPPMGGSFHGGPPMMGGSFHGGPPHVDRVVSTHADVQTVSRAVPHTTASTHVDLQTSYGPQGQHQVYDIYGKVKWKKKPIYPGLANKLFGPKEYRPVYKKVQGVPRTVTDFGYRTQAVPHTTFETHADVVQEARVVPHTTVTDFAHGPPPMAHGPPPMASASPWMPVGGGSFHGPPGGSFHGGPPMGGSFHGYP
eukprot:NODE_1438_length_872_cov_365.426488_g1112_i2.p1 GENE.NODE_1438_length_872_cov_365.426488_g1112_i2~~NODE_1438_length_872_cov_365.426488_g1112_i2.p1  ORF type:complete len:204 (+),score=34.36 NODE_1438_length_872_cov_365.426488_g1112_i2:29-640(+)